MRSALLEGRLDKKVYFWVSFDFVNPSIYIRSHLKNAKLGNESCPFLNLDALSAATSLKRSFLTLMKEQTSNVPNAAPCPLSGSSARPVTSWAWGLAGANRKSLQNPAVQEILACHLTFRAQQSHRPYYHRLSLC